MQLNVQDVGDEAVKESEENDYGSTVGLEAFLELVAVGHSLLN